jgi:hypothetical protein
MGQLTLQTGADPMLIVNIRTAKTHLSRLIEAARRRDHREEQ